MLCLCLAVTVQANDQSLVNHTLLFYYSVINSGSEFNHSSYNVPPNYQRVFNQRKNFELHNKQSLM